MKRAQVVVRGAVQGVFFRVEARDRARSLGVAGWVRNTADGSVEAVLEGEDERVESMVDWCRRGPARSARRRRRGDLVRAAGRRRLLDPVSFHVTRSRHNGTRVTGVELLNRRVVLDGIELGRVVDVILDETGERPVGFDVLCGDGSHRFLPYATALLDGETVEVGSPLVLLGRDQLEFYRRHGRALRS